MFQKLTELFLLSFFSFNFKVWRGNFSFCNFSRRSVDVEQNFTPKRAWRNLWSRVTRPEPFCETDFDRIWVDWLILGRFSVKGENFRVENPHAWTWINAENICLAESRVVINCSWQNKSRSFVLVEHPNFAIIAVWNYYTGGHNLMIAWTFSFDRSLRRYIRGRWLAKNFVQYDLIKIDLIGWFFWDTFRYRWVELRGCDDDVVFVDWLHFSHSTPLFPEGDFSPNWGGAGRIGVIFEIAPSWNKKKVYFFLFIL